jgi:hypothetical protein
MIAIGPNPQVTLPVTDIRPAVLPTGLMSGAMDGLAATRLMAMPGFAAELSAVLILLRTTETTAAANQARPRLADTRAAAPQAEHRPETGPIAAGLFAWAAGRSNLARTRARSKPGRNRSNEEDHG